MEGSELPRSKRLKTLASSPASTSKGKEKTEESVAQTGCNDVDSTAEATCGICLSEGKLSIRGWIDSCNHYFCFICIMEWAKVETRCPMCKQRFRSIRRSPVQGIFAFARVVDVPVRDQVYHPLGNESTMPSDPYADIVCSECHTYTNEELLLLCDLCDSASHTYCVGLGATVPEGDWYCSDCTIMREEQSKTHSDSDGCNQDSLRNLKAVRVAEPSVSILEIVSDEIPSYSSERLSTTQALEQQSNDRRPPPRRTTSSESQLEISSSVETTGVEQAARTLQQCRNLQDRIRALRENWKALRTGSLAFSSSLVISSDKDCDGKRRSIRVDCDISRQPDSLPSVNCEQSADASSASSKAHNGMGSRDVNKAWKMMEIAKSTQGTQRAKTNISKGAGNHHSSSSDMKDWKKQKLVAQTVKEVKHFHGGPQKPRLSGQLEVSSTKQDELLIDEDLCDGKNWQADKQNASKYRDSGGCSLSGASSLSPLKLVEFSCFEVESDNEKQGTSTSCDESSIRRNYISNDSAKDEVQSLVKLNLKLLSRDRHLGTDRFKEVARTATHTILATCGLEHSKSNAPMFPSPICRHAEQMKELRKSNLMPDSCRECFYFFVKDVVNFLLAEK